MNKLISAAEEQDLLCANFATCGNAVTKPARGFPSRYCPDCRRARDAARKREARQPSFTAEKEAESLVIPERYVEAVRFEVEWREARLDGAPFVEQFHLANSSLQELRPEGYDKLYPDAAPRWCRCNEWNGGTVAPFEKPVPLGGAILAPGAVCPNCGHQLSPGLSVLAHHHYIGAGPYPLRSAQNVKPPRQGPGRPGPRRRP
jgi:hypothetical protein